MKYWSYRSLFLLLPRPFTILASIPHCWLEYRIQRFLKNWTNYLKLWLERNHQQWFIKSGRWFLRELCTILNDWTFAQRIDFQKFFYDLRVQLWPNKTHCLYTAIDFCYCQSKNQASFHLATLVFQQVVIFYSIYLGS